MKLDTTARNTLRVVPGIHAAALVALIASAAAGPLPATTIAGDYVPADAFQRYNAVSHYDARNRVYEMFSEGIVAPDGASWFDDGTILVYQTSDGRFGKLIVARYESLLYLRWVTWNRSGQVASQSVRSFQVAPSYTLDLDTGQLAPPPGEADVHWGIGLDDRKVFSCRNGARVAFYELALDFQSLPVSILRTTPVERTSVSGSFAGENAPIIYRTSEGRIGKLIVNPTWWNFRGFRLYAETRNLDGSLHRHGYASAYYETSYTSFGPYRIPTRRLVPLSTVDLDDGRLNESSQGEDLQGYGDYPTWWSFSARSGARFAVYGKETPDLRYETIDVDFIASAALSASEIDASRLTPGTIVLYQTAQGRLGKLEIVDSGYDLVARWRTFCTSTTTWSAGAELLVPGTASCDLDIGAGSVDYFSVHGDFRWAPITSSVRRLQPKNGARFFVYTPQGPGFDLEVQRIRTDLHVLKDSELELQRIVPDGALVLNEDG